MNSIVIHNARVHNLQSVSLTLPRDKFIVFTGVSGSGKSSLAFDTIYTEGQRRYVESLSTYARQFIGQFDKPDVEAIDGLSPAIAIDQKTVSKSPRSTVGTVTEIYDYLRVLYARIGKAHCPGCGESIHPQTQQQIVSRAQQLPEGTKLQILAPVVRGRKGDYNALFKQLRKEGFFRVRINGELQLLDELPDDHRLSRMKTHSIEVIIDRVVIKPDETSQHRVAQAIQTALKKADDFVILDNITTGNETFYSLHLACPTCNIGFEEMAPRLFSFNSPYGYCAECQGLGFQQELSEAMLVSEASKSILEGAIPAIEKILGRYAEGFLSKLSKKYKLPLSKPWEDLTIEHQQFILYGRSGQTAYHLPDGPNEEPRDSDWEDDWFGLVNEFDGFVPIFLRQMQFGPERNRNYLSGYFQEVTCTSCQGKRLKPFSLGVTLGNEQIGQKSIADFCQFSVKDAYQYTLNLIDSLDDEPDATFKLIGHQALKEVSHRLKFLTNVGLGYLFLDRRSGTLSGGESQRIRLATQIGAGLSGVLYVMDEPSIGLHPYNNRQLIETLHQLRDQGNSLIVVEHDEDTIRSADWLVDIGPKAGIHGGMILAEGHPSEVIQHPDSLTGAYLSGALKLPITRKPRKGNGEVLTLKGASLHNLKNISVDFPLGKLIAITGMSGSGKSTLIFDLLHQSLKYELGQPIPKPLGLKKITGVEHLDKVIEMDQSPIGRSSRSNPATYTGLFDLIRKVFANTELSRIRGYQPGRFSFNVKGGRCETCKGEGEIAIEMNFLPDAHSHCDDCNGRRYNAETLEVTYESPQGQKYSIADVLDLTVEEAQTVFLKQPAILRILTVLNDVGLGYVHLGQAAPTLSGGESQRLKLATELCRKSTGKTLYLLDEPTIGLHWYDLEKLIKILNRLVDQGNTVIVIEHNLDLIKAADYVIDMGPEGGNQGGEVIFEGPPHLLAQCETSYTGQFLKPYFD